MERPPEQRVELDPSKLVLFALVFGVPLARFVVSADHAPLSPERYHRALLAPLGTLVRVVGGPAAFALLLMPLATLVWTFLWHGRGALLGRRDVWWWLAGTGAALLAADWLASGVWLALVPAVAFAQLVFERSRARGPRAKSMRARRWLERASTALLAREVAVCGMLTVLFVPMLPMLARLDPGAMTPVTYGEDWLETTRALGVPLASVIAMVAGWSLALARSRGRDALRARSFVPWLTAGGAAAFVLACAPPLLTFVAPFALCLAHLAFERVVLVAPEAPTAA